jgi:cation/acetate symporter
MVGLAFAIAASANFPTLLLAIFWKRFTTRGAVAGILTGLILAILLIVISPTVWVDILKKPAALFPLKNPGLFSMAGGFLAAVIGSLTSRENRAEEMFAGQKLRSYVGIGAE